MRENDGRKFLASFFAGAGLERVAAGVNKNVRHVTMRPRRNRGSGKME